MTVSNRVVICSVCDKHIEVRWGIFASNTLSRHMKTQKHQELMKTILTPITH